jgi:hypothetical protein
LAEEILRPDRSERTTPSGVSVNACTRLAAIPLRDENVRRDQELVERMARLELSMTCVVVMPVLIVAVVGMPVFGVTVSRSMVTRVRPRGVRGAGTSGGAGLGLVAAAGQRDRGDRQHRRHGQGRQKSGRE